MKIDSGENCDRNLFSYKYGSGYFRDDEFVNRHYTVFSFTCGAPFPSLFLLESNLNMLQTC